VADEVVGYDKKIRGYFVTHDIYALEKIIEAAFHRHDDLKDFYGELGNPLPIRRAFRHWLSDRLCCKKSGGETTTELFFLV
jgi:hypothetical protein